MYAQASTANPLGKRPWNSRLRGLSYYQGANFVLPTRTPGYSIGPAGSDQVTGGLGLDLTSLTSGNGLLIAGGALLAGLWLFGKKRRRK